MHHFDGHDVQIADGQRLMGVDLIQPDGWHAGITVLCKTVRQHLKHPFPGNGIGIDVDLTKLTIRTDIIHTAHMVIMAVGDQDAVDPTKRFGKDLLTEIRTAVD